jgi:hypothetical protein
MKKSFSLCMIGFLLFASKDLIGAECTNIAGKWLVSESITYTCVIQGDSFTDSDSGEGVFRL